MYVGIILQGNGVPEKYRHRQQQRPGPVLTFHQYPFSRHLQRLPVHFDTDVGHIVAHWAHPVHRSSSPRLPDDSPWHWLLFPVQDFLWTERNTQATAFTAFSIYCDLCHLQQLLSFKTINQPETDYKTGDGQWFEAGFGQKKFPGFLIARESGKGVKQA